MEKKDAVSSLLCITEGGNFAVEKPEKRTWGDSRRKKMCQR